MSEKRIVKGLFGALQADADGVEWETDSSELKQEIENERLISLAHHAMQRLSEDPRLAALFFNVEKPLGQPPKQPFQTNNAKRAMALYMAARCICEARGYGKDATFEMHLLKHITLAKALFPTNDIFDKPKASNKMRASVKRGREILGIDRYWRSSNLEDLLNTVWKIC